MQCPKVPPTVTTFLAAIVGATLLAACASRPAATPGALARYDLSRPADAQVRLPAELHEVSGLAVTSDGRLFAHGDEEGRVYQVDPATGRVLKSFGLQPGAGEVDLGKKSKDGRVTGDFEDIAIAGDRFFLVTSNGVLLEFKEGEDGSQVPFTAHATALADACEVEGLAHDAAADALLLLCKEMKEKSQRDRVELFAWSLADGRLAPAPRAAIAFSTLAQVTGGRAFNASAITRIPGSESLAIIAGPQRLFAEIAADGKPVAGGTFASGELVQPEGIAFLPDGTLLISSEGGKGVATIAAYRPR